MSNLLRLDPFFTAFEPIFSSAGPSGRRRRATLGEAELRFSNLEEARQSRVRSFMPSFEVSETDAAYVLEADLPGVAQDALEISVDGRELVVAGSRTRRDEAEGEKLHFRERTYGSFRRTFTLPEEVDAESIEANLDSGVLTLRLPKQPQSKPRKIPIKVA